MSHNALALQIPLNGEPEIETVTDPDAFDDANRIVYQDFNCIVVNDIDLIEEELCRSHPSGTHVYLGHSVHCIACATAHPSIRNARGQV